MRVQNFESSCLILICFSSLIFNLIIIISGQCLQDQEKLLLELKNGLKYDSSLSTKLVQWNESVDCCKWGGVECDFTGHVTGLDLSGESITAGIDDAAAGDSLFSLEFLKSLNLAQNNFDSVNLPSGFGKLEALSYLNLSNSGFIGQIPVEFSSLTRLVVLDLSSSLYTSLQLENPDLKTLIRNFTRLRELYLDGVNISANGAVWCNAVSSLPDLRVLSLSNSYLTGPFDSSLAKLLSLEVIRLDGNPFFSPIPELFGDFSKLRILTLSACDLTGVTPGKLFQISSLQTIDLSNNRILEGSLPEFPLNGSLQNLLLSYTNFSGNLTDSIGRLGMLSRVELRACNFSGPIPYSISNLTQIVFLDLSINHFIGSVPSFSLSKNITVINLRSNRLTGEIFDSLWEGLEILNFLDLSENSLEGEIPSSLLFLPSLKVLYLSNNKFYGPIKDWVNGSFSLEVLELSVNNLEGPVPRVLFELRNLSTLSLSSNKFNGTINLTDFQKLTNLVSLDLSYNNLSVHITENFSMSSLFPRLGTLMLASCKLQKVPLLKNQTSLKMLDLSDNQLDGEIPNWIWDVGDGLLRFLNLSHNQFTGLQEPYTFHGLDYLDLHSNLLGGTIPVPSPPAYFVDLSSNNFSSFIPVKIGQSLLSSLFFSIANNRVKGTIPSSLCNATHLQVLDLSNNSLNGVIPSCLIGNNNLGVLNLERNNFSGDIPDRFQIGCALETLDLSWNLLQEQVPKSLENCTKLEVLNLGNNNLTGTFPCWLKKLSRLRILVLRNNRFYGDISCLGNNTWADLQIMNLASNNLNGVLPESLFPNLKAMMVDKDATEVKLDFLRYDFLAASQYYQYTVTVTLKGLELELEKILTIFTSVDFSGNHFQEVIPETIGVLKSLYVLNFSHNALSGQMPSSLGNLQQLESLDFSFNNLGAEIPNQLADLTYLSVLNLSYNQLVGRIPQGRQLQTFTESSFKGNKGLCGFPLNITCIDARKSALQQPTLKAEQELLDINEIYSSAAMGFFVGLGVIFGPLLFSKRFRKYHDKIVNKLFLLVFHQLENDWSP